MINSIKCLHDTQKKIFANIDKLPNETEKLCEEFFFLGCHRYFEENSQGIKPNSNE